MSKRLGKQDWIAAGIKALTAGGAEAVRVEPLAAALGVTKGSFYWHFKDRAELLAAILDAWAAVATRDIIAKVEATADSARARLEALASIVVQSDGRVDLAMRSWAEGNARVRAAVDEVDSTRLTYLVAQFCDLGFSEREAEARARLVYRALIGQYTIGDRQSRADRVAEYLDIIVPMLVRPR